MGVGERLVRALLEAAFGSGGDFVRLAVNEDNLAAIRLYKKCGFRRLPREGPWLPEIERLEQLSRHSYVAMEATPHSPRQAAEGAASSHSGRPVHP